MCLDTLISKLESLKKKAGFKTVKKLEFGKQLMMMEIKDILKSGRKELEPFVEMELPAKMLVKAHVQDMEESHNGFTKMSILKLAGQENTYYPSNKEFNPLRTKSNLC